MTFPVYLHLGPWLIHPHLFFESLAYFIGARIYWRFRRPSAMGGANALLLVAGAAAGAALGAKLVAWLEDPARLAGHYTEFVFWASGKTIVGALLGGLIGVETVKKMIGWTRSTGDDFVYPLLVGMAIGRVGCFLTGLDDHTFGTATSLPWGVDFGDGIRRHPTQLYEIVFLVLLGLVLYGLQRREVQQGRGETQRWRGRDEGRQVSGLDGKDEPVDQADTMSDNPLAAQPPGFPGVSPTTRSAKPLLADGLRFELFMTAYLLFRFAVDFIKPTPHPYAGLNNIQIACLLGLLYYTFKWRQRRQIRRGELRRAS